MAALWTLALVLFAGTACSANRIVGGSPTAIETYPSIVQVDRMLPDSPVWAQACAGSILNSFYILSAAHCFYGSTYSGTPSRRIRYGTNYSESGGSISYVTSVLIHPTWQTFYDGYDGDIALIRVTTAILYSSAAQPTAIVSGGFELPDDTPVTLVGWGATESDGSNSEELQEVTVNTINHELCWERYDLNTPYVVTRNMICAGVLNVGGKDACQGDSGGPIYFQNIQVGIVSWREDCADSYFPGVNTKVSAFTDWIVANAV